MESSNKPPTPPPLPPVVQKRQPKQQTQPAYIASLEAAGLNSMETSCSFQIEREPYCPIYYFFYGTLTKPEILKHILDIEEPVLRPAKVVDYSLASWGQYPALIDGRRGEEVKGYAYEVRAVEHEYKLARYETNAYRVAECFIRFTDIPDDKEDSNRVVGNTFMYAGDSQALKDGRFDRTLWELQMGLRLPDKWRMPAPPLGGSLEEAGISVTKHTDEEPKTETR